MKILLKYPSRQRRVRFFDSLETIYNLAADKDSFHVHCTFDTDDPSMNNEEVKSKLSTYSNLSFIFGSSESKIDAINRDLKKLPPFDILVCFSDDMRFVVFGWDVLIRDAFRGTDMDLLVHFPEPDSKEDLATMYIAGFPFFNRLKYIYHPSYKSLFCDNEILETAKALDKYKYVPYTIYHHLNPAYGHLQRDKLFNDQQDVGYDQDFKNYTERKKRGFGIEKIKNKGLTPLLTITFPTTVDRRPLFNKLQAKVGRQLMDFYPHAKWTGILSPIFPVRGLLVDNVEILVYEDNKEISIGNKRQMLLDAATGEFVVGIDSDDDIADTYIEDILTALDKNPDTDHVGFYEYCTFDGINPKRSLFSIRFKHWAENIDGYDYVRCANPKSVIRRSKALKVGYCDCRYGEDVKFSEMVTPLLESEVFIDKDLYFYRYVSQEHNEKYGISGATK